MPLASHTTRYQQPRPAPVPATFTRPTPLAARVTDSVIAFDEDAAQKQRIKNWTPGAPQTRQAQAATNRANAEALLREGHDPVAVADALVMNRQHVKRIARRLGLAE